MTDIRGRRVLITGSAKGMGAEMARRFASAGAELVLVDIDADGLEATAHELRRRGHRVYTSVRDLSSRQAIRQLHDEIREEVGRTDILVNNAGFVEGGHYDENEDEADEMTFAVNMEAVHWMTKTFLGDLKEGRDTHLVQMASAAGFMGIPYQILYAASKWFVIGLTEGLRLELQQEGHHHVGTTIVCPALVDTGMFDGSDAPLLTPTLDPEYVVDQIVEAVREDSLYVKEPFMIKAAPLIRALLPPELNDLMMEALGVTDIMHNWEGRDSEIG